MSEPYHACECGTVVYKSQLDGSRCHDAPHYCVVDQLQDKYELEGCTGTLDDACEICPRSNDCIYHHNWIASKYGIEPHECNV